MPWLLDLLTAASGSIGLNGLGAFLVAFGSHPPHGTAAPKKGDAEPAKQDAPLAATVLALPPSNPGPVARFMVDRIEAAPRGSLKWPICFLHIRRGATLTATARCPSPFGDALAPMLEAVGIERKARGENVYLVGVKLAS